MTIILAGYTGLTGSFVLAKLQAHQGVDKIICVGRKPPTFQHKTDFVPLSDVAGEASSPEATAVICCIGTTMAKARSKEAFRKVDFDIPVRLAMWTKQRASKFILMSSVGANAASGNFYLKTKGETEAAVPQAFDGPVFVLRPSILIGPREEKRLGERIGIIGAKLAAPFLKGKSAVYKPIHVADVATAMVSIAVSNEAVPNVLQYHDIIRLTRSSR